MIHAEQIGYNPTPEARRKRKKSQPPIVVDLEAEEDGRQTSKLVISREEIMAEANSQVEEITTLSGLRLTVECDEVSGDDPLDTSDEEMPIVLEKAKKKTNKKEVKQTPAETEADRKLRRLIANWNTKEHSGFFNSGTKMVAGPTERAQTTPTKWIREQEHTQLE